MCAGDGCVRVYSGTHARVGAQQYGGHCQQHSLVTLGDDWCAVPTDWRVADVLGRGGWRRDPVADWSWRHRGTGIMTAWERAETLRALLLWHLARLKPPC